MTTCPKCQRQIGDPDNRMSLALFNQCYRCYLEGWVQHTAHLHYDDSKPDGNNYRLTTGDVWIGLVDPSTGALGADLYIKLTAEGVTLDLYGRIGDEHSPETAGSTWAFWDEMAYAVTGESS